MESCLPVVPQSKFLNTLDHFYLEQRSYLVSQFLEHIQVASWMHSMLTTVGGPEVSN